MTDAVELVAALRAANATVATAESLTGGLVCAALVDVPGASDAVRGGVVAYATDLKTTLLGVGADHLSTHGTVDARTAELMAAGVRERLGATYGLATTGVAGPDPSENKPAGTVYVAVAGPSGTRSGGMLAGGDRGEVRRSTVDAVLSLLLGTVKSA